MSSVRLLVEHCPIALSQHLHSGVFVAVSPACARLFGIAEAELVGRDLFAIVRERGGEDAAVVSAAWTQACATGSEGRVRFRYVRPDGTSIFIQATLGPVTESPHLVLCCQDVTADVAREEAREKRLAEAEVAERHRDYLVDMIPGLVWFGPVSADLSSYRAVYMSDYLFRVTGYTAEQWLQTPGFWRSILHPEDRDSVLAAVADAMRSGATLGPYRVRASDGRYLWIQSRMQLERDADGVPRRMYGLTLDMSSFMQAKAERMEALERMEILKRRLDALVSTLPGIVWERWLLPGHEPENFCSEYVERLTGHDRTEWTNGAQGWLRFVPESSRAAITAAVDRIIELGGGSLQHPLRTKDGRELWLENHIIVVRGEDGAPQCLRGVALDLTERKHAEAAQRTLQQAMSEQARQLLELSAPLIPISDDVLVLPLIGTLDPVRAQHSLDTLLHSVTSLRIRHVLVDLTGVGVVDTIGATTLLRMISAAQLLGARVILTGMRPEIARALSQLDVDISSIRTCSSLRAAVQEFVVSRQRQSSKHPETRRRE